jgi:hypothetical protein
MLLSVFALFFLFLSLSLALERRQQQTRISRKESRVYSTRGTTERKPSLSMWAAAPPFFEAK